MASSQTLLHDHLLDLHVVAVDEAQHVDTRSGVHVDVGAAVDAFAAEDAACDVDHLQGGGAIVVDDEAAIAEEGEVVVIAVVASGEHELETVGIVGRLGLEAVARGLEQVDVLAGQVVDEVQIGEADVLAVEAQGVAAVLLGLEADGHLTHLFAADDGVVLAVDRDVDLGATLSELELGQLATSVEAHDGAVDEVAAVAEVEGEHGALALRIVGGEGHCWFLFILSGHDKDALHGLDVLAFDGSKEYAVRIHGVETTVALEPGGNGEGIAYEVPTWEINMISLS